MKNVTDQMKTMLKDQGDVIQKLAQTGLKVGKIYRQSIVQFQKKNPFLNRSVFTTEPIGTSMYAQELNQRLEQWFDSMEMYVSTYTNLQHLLIDQWEEANNTWVESMEMTPIKLAEFQTENFNKVWGALYNTWDTMEKYTSNEYVQDTLKHYFESLENFTKSVK